jgi:predicted transcriptional regulator
VVFPGEYFNKIKKATQLRIENKLLHDFTHATFDPDKDQCGAYGALATWINIEYLENFNKEKWTNAAVKKFLANENGSREYVEDHFLNNIMYLNTEDINDNLKRLIKKLLLEKNTTVINYFQLFVLLEESHPWMEIFKKEIEEIIYKNALDLPF